MAGNRPQSSFERCAQQPASEPQPICSDCTIVMPQRPCQHRAVFFRHCFGLDADDIPTRAWCSATAFIRIGGRWEAWRGPEPTHRSLPMDCNGRER